MKRDVSLTLLRLAWVGGLTLIATPVTYAQPNGLVEVEQVIFGMDCAPCAYGIERSLKKLPGAENVHVSLNEGKASIRFRSGSDVTLLDIRNRILDGGFTPKDARIRAIGTVTVRGGEIRLSSGARATFILKADPSTDSSPLRDLQSGLTVEITGAVAEKAGDPPAVALHSLKLVERSTSDR
jgi:copper chaperone CopZ